MRRVGRRCSIGCESWPDKPIFSNCPICGESTRRVSNLDPLDDAEADSILLHKQFDRFYERWCAQRDQSVDGPLKEAPPDAAKVC